ncbi:hypothetical protein CEXT_249981 [Caerostris extrusa]|uniref:Uncharacterized protein n=1 Tax=Caerostris extrusa TaxID=172846 RepID=A0AAV4M6Q6_CAEEX|nr:hypothetical protein CEXT_249981 [Caerostris extrusa]
MRVVASLKTKDHQSRFVSQIWIRNSRQQIDLVMSPNQATDRPCDVTKSGSYLKYGPVTQGKKINLRMSPNQFVSQIWICNSRQKINLVTSKNQARISNMDP